MSQPTLNSMIEAAILGAEEADADVREDVTTQEDTSGVSAPPEHEDAEKLASALAYIGERGIENILVKEGGAADPPPGTNIDTLHGATTKKQVGPHAGAPPMKPPGSGNIPTNADKKPGGGKEVDTAGKGHGTHHKGLSSNEAAIGVTKSDKAKQVAPSLKAVLDTTPYADPKPKELLNHAKGSGEKNIHSKQAHDLSQVREELAKRVAAATEEN